MSRTLNVGDFKKLISESSTEFKAKLGPGVESKDKEINDKAYSDAKKRAKDFDGGLSDKVEKAKYKKVDANRTTLDYEPENATPEYKKRVHAQSKGYTSDAEMKNGIEKTGDFSDNEEIYKAFKDNSEEMAKNVKDFKRSGLQARELPEKTFDKENMYESKDGFDMRQMIDKLSNMEKNYNNVSENTQPKSIKTVYFKKTEFINENHMINKIPDDFKVNGNSFNMKDKAGNIYLVEWKNNKANIINHINKEEINEEMSRMKQLMGFKSLDSCTTSSNRLNENDDTFRSTLNKIREIK